MIDFAQRNKKLVGLPIAIALILASFIFWRENELRDQVPLFKVILWQMAIWIPWILGFAVLDRALRLTQDSKYRSVKILALCAGLIALHFGWFFMISSNFSPYIGQYGCRFGVFRYFFVFWTFIDIVLLWFVVDKLQSKSPEEASLPFRLELTRGNNTYFCEPSQIHYLASENYYTKLFTTEGVFVMRKPLKYFQELLPQQIFKKIHRSTIINVNHVSELARGQNSKLDVIMKDGTRRRVSRNFAKDISNFFKSRTA
ncbi:LytTR family DNA-binding domain-containing protein [Poritiphilus flavus]|uniref:HTH LytTR-type domain-containing protein n=1 Tax=Poritiphilus flavus TaxID=2697053 RepID=A0A6L9E7B9_9FLAO|nr:LytTR family DNA-binding domain-containing protein [Poritiphilus flavus]NAS10524.1 hypothetical protein [Poritiphilus flavus]